MAFAFVLLYGQNPIPATLFVIAYSDKGRPLRTIITALLENGFLTKGHDLIIWTIISSSVQSSLSIFAQKYLCKCKDTYFILQNKYLCIHEDSFGAKIHRDDCVLILHPDLTLILSILLTLV